MSVALAHRHKAYIARQPWFSGLDANEKALALETVVTACSMHDTHNWSKVTALANDEYVAEVYNQSVKPLVLSTLEEVLSVLEGIPIVRTAWKQRLYRH